MQIAAIDIGSNSIHMVIARTGGAAGFEVVDREREVVQVGRGSFRGGRLRPEAVKRTIEALARFVELARRRQVDRILCTATAAVRESGNAGRFIAAAREATGIAPRVIPPEEEGRLNYLAVKSALQLDASPALIVDIGGGSMQLAVGNKDRLLGVSSAPLGSLRLTETFLEHDPPTHGELAKLERHIRKQARDTLADAAAHGPVRAYGASGSIHALAQLAHQDGGQGLLEPINGYVLETEALRRITRRLQRMSHAERDALKGLDTMRAEIIVPGAMVLLHVLETLELDSITMSDFGVREGLVTDYLTNHAREISISGQAEDLRMRSALQVLQKFQPEEWQLRHSRHVAHLALELFDGLAIEHHLGPEERDVLQFAALLHDVGAAVGYDGHAEHSYYLIHNANLRGLSPDELERVALVARYHGKGRPRKRDPRVRALDKDARRSVRWLSAILRLAEALDRSHYQLVRDLKVHRRGKQFAIRVETKRGAQLEIWSARGRADQLERMLGRAVKISSARPAEREKRVVGSAARPATPAANGEPKRATPTTPMSSAESGRAPAAPARSAIVPLRRRGA